MRLMRLDLLVSLALLGWCAVGCRGTDVKLHDESIRQYRLGEHYFRDGSYVKAEEHYKRALNVDDRNAYAYRRLGMINIARGYFEQAEEYLRKAVKIDPDEAAHLDQLGVALVGRRKYQRALSTFRKALNKREDYFPSKYHIVGVYRRLKRLNKARVQCLQLLSTYPQKAEPHLEMGLLYLAQGDQHQAKRSFKRAIDRDSKLIEPHFELAKIYLQLKQYRLCLTHLQKVLSIKTTHSEARHMFGVARRAYMASGGR